MIKQVYWISDEEWKRIEPLLPRGAAVRIPLRPSLSFRYTHTLLRAAAACTMPDLWHAIATALKGFSLDECQNYLAAAGYDATARKML
jgi:transposase